MDEEQYDVLDEKGNKTGQVLAKTAVHEQQLWHASVFVWIYNSRGEVLLQFRSKDKKTFPSVWDVSVAGHISAGDEPLQTAVREIKEEIGIDVSIEELVQVAYTHDIVPWVNSKKHYEFCWIYILHRNIDIKDIKIQKEELTKVKWMPINELLTVLKDPIKSKEYAKRKMSTYLTPLNQILNVD